MRPTNRSGGKASNGLPGVVRKPPFSRIILVLVVVSVCLASVSCFSEKETPTPLPTLRPTFTPTPLVSDTPTPDQVAEATVSLATVTPEVSEPAPDTSATPDQNPGESPTGAPTTAATEPAPTSPPASGKPVSMKSPDYGMQAFLWWRPEVAQRDMELIRDAGFGWVKQAFAWREIEGTGKGQFDWTVTDRIVDQAESIGLHMIARLDTDPTWASGRSYPNNEDVIMSPPAKNKDFADFCFEVASRYKGRIAAYQIWNEPNLKREWGGNAPDPAAYVALLRAGSKAIKRADPNAIIISAGLAPTTRSDNVAMPDTEFLRQMYAAGAQPHFDALGAHGAGYKAPPEKDPAEVANDPNFYNQGDPYCPGPACRIYCFRHVEDLHQIMVDNGDTQKKVVVLEFGWTMDSREGSPYAWHAVSEELQAAYFTRAYKYAKENWQPWIGIMSLIYMPSIDWTEDDEQFWWSIAAPNYPQFYPYKAYRDLAVMPK